MTQTLFLFSLCSILLTGLAYPVLAANENDKPQTPTIAPTEALNACRGMSEKDSCQAHKSNNELVTGVCKTTSIASNDFQLLCTADKPVAKTATDGDNIKDNTSDSHAHNRKRHSN